MYKIITRVYLLKVKAYILGYIEFIFLVLICHYLLLFLNIITYAQEKGVKGTAMTKTTSEIKQKTFFFFEKTPHARPDVKAFKSLQVEEKFCFLFFLVEFTKKKIKIKERR